MASLRVLRSTCCAVSQGSQLLITLISIVITLTSPSRATTMAIIPFICLLFIINLMKEEREEKIEITVEELAYRKIVYHLLRYPASKVTGVLVGNDRSKVSNAYPLFHTPLVNPTFSVALDLIESNLIEGETIVGFYQFVEGSQPKINSLIQANPLLKDMLTMRVWVDLDRNVQLASAKFNFNHPDWSKLSLGLKRGDYRFLVDMDAHFQEIELDFRNSYLN